MRVYEEDYKLVLQMKRKQRKRHPKWQRSKKLRYKLWGGSIVIAFVAGLYGFFTLGGLLGSFFGGVGVFIIVAIPAAIYTIAIAEECEDFIGCYEKEFIVIDDEMVKYGYKTNKDRGK